MGKIVRCIEDSGDNSLWFIPKGELHEVTHREIDERNKHVSYIINKWWHYGACFEDYNKLKIDPKWGN